MNTEENGKNSDKKLGNWEYIRTSMAAERAQKKVDKQLKKAARDPKFAAELRAAAAEFEAAANPPPPRKNPGGIYEKAAKFAEQKRLDDEQKQLEEEAAIEAAKPPESNTKEQKLTNARTGIQRQEVTAAKASTQPHGKSNGEKFAEHIKSTIWIYIIVAAKLFILYSCITEGGGAPLPPCRPQDLSCHG